MPLIGFITGNNCHAHKILNLHLNGGHSPFKIRSALLTVQYVFWECPWIKSIQQMLLSLGTDNLSWLQVMELDGLVAVEIYVMAPGSNLLGHLH